MDLQEDKPRFQRHTMMIIMIMIPRFGDGFNLVHLCVLSLQDMKVSNFSTQ